MSEIINNENPMDVESETMNSTKEFNPATDDALMKLVNQHKNKIAAQGEEAGSAKMIRKEIPLVDDDNKIISVDSDKAITNEKLPVSKPTPTDEDEFGDNDLQKEMEAQDAREQHEREEAIKAERERKAAEEAKKKANTYAYKDPVEMGEAVGFQADKIAMINRMTQMVLKKYFIKEGEIPETYPAEGAGKHLTRLQCLGELTALYEANGAYITPEFEQIILHNWQMDKGKYIC